MQGVTLTVSQLNDYVRRSMASDPILQQVTLRGEISNFKPSAPGHWYFTLKDEQSRIDCALFRQYTYRITFVPRDGMNVLVTGSVGLYVQGGKYQFYADGMKQDGMGDLYQKYLALKEKLTAEGLFDVSRKRPLPLLPRKVGIVTSSTGAVLHDIRTVAGRRFPGIPLVLRPAQVQGDGAAQDVANGLRELAAVPGIDVIIVGRGGGSMEDLWAFNEEVVVRAVAASPVPVISAVGHETDTTLCDYAADMRAPTPSAAAELAVPELAGLIGNIEEMRKRLFNAAQNTAMNRRQLMQALQLRLSAVQPLNHIRQMLQQTELLRQRLYSAQEKKIAQGKANTEVLHERLRSAGPRQVLERGYSIVLKNDKPISSVRQAKENLTVIFRDGCAEVRVLSQKEVDPFAR